MARFLGLLIALALVEGALAQGSSAQFGVSFEWVPVGDPGNPNDPFIGPAIGAVVPRPERGSVPYVYNISKYETTIGQYSAFLNAAMTV